ncbi:integrase core domain-containing protein [Halorhodospira halochloris]|uniref:integrase core domain-containing protein n=1 Tax=Halorhodospira halochloris TaxID=1052 RepID=UPI001EE84B02|nr:integrase core domain-containing protein [Halorhodospira halochloris]
MGHPRSTFYARRHSGAQRAAQAHRKRRPGPRPRLSDEQLHQEIRALIQGSEFTGEGQRKVWAKLRQLRGVYTSRKRVLRVMREHELLAPYRARRNLGPDVHDGTIVTEAPNRMWATDATATFLPECGQVTVFAVVDHYNAECLGIHAARPGTRFEALEPLRQAVRRVCAGFHEGIAAGVALRHDHGSQYVSDAFQRELGFLGLESSPAFVYAPEGNGVIERFFRTLKEQLLWCHGARTVAELNEALQRWRERYNQGLAAGAPWLPVAGAGPCRLP